MKSRVRPKVVFRLLKSSLLVIVVASLSSPVSGAVVSSPVEMSGYREVVGGVQPRLARSGTSLLSSWTGNGLLRIGWGRSLDGGISWTRDALGPNDFANPTDDYPFGAATLVADRLGHAYVVYRTVGRFDLVHRVIFQRGMETAGSWAWEPPITAVAVGTWEGTNADSPWLACDPDRGYLYLAYVAYTLPNMLLINGPANQPVYFLRSLDGGQTWSAPSLMGGPAALGSRVEVGANGEVLLFWQDYQSKQVMLRRSEDFGATFSPVQSVAGFVDMSRTRLRGMGDCDGRSHPLNYWEAGNVYDFPQLAVDRSNGPNRGTLYMVWAEGAEGTLGPYSGRMVAETEPNDTPLTANPMAIGDSYSSFGESEGSHVPPNGDYFIFQGTRGQMVALATGMSEFPSAPGPFQAMQNGFAILDEATGIAPTLFTGAGLKDASAPPTLASLPATARYVIGAAASGGPRATSVFGTLWEFLPSPGSIARDHRDIVLLRSRDGGRTWSPKVRVNDDPPGSDQAMPVVAVDEQGLVHVAWMDRRDGAQPGLTAAPYWTVSVDGGLTFRPSLKVGPSSDYIGYELGGIGDFIALLPDAGGVLVAWPNHRLDWLFATVVRISDLPTSIAVPRFTAEPDGDAVRVAWKVQDARGITGFALHRAPAGTEAYELLATVPSRGTGEHTYTDRAVQPGEGYVYRLEVKHGTSSTWEGPTEVRLPPGISSLTFERVGPNPFERETRLVLALPRRDRLDVRVYDVQGHEVRRLYTGEAPAGRHVLAWDGRDSGGREAAPGVYHLTATGAGQRATKSIVRIR